MAATATTNNADAAPLPRLDRATTLDKVLTIIRRAGFTPAQRDSFYTVRGTFDPPAPLGIQ